MLWIPLHIQFRFLLWSTPILAFSPLASVEVFVWDEWWKWSWNDWVLHNLFHFGRLHSSFWDCDISVQEIIRQSAEIEQRSAAFMAIGVASSITHIYILTLWSWNLQSYVLEEGQPIATIAICCNIKQLPLSLSSRQGGLIALDGCLSNFDFVAKLLVLRFMWKPVKY